MLISEVIQRLQDIKNKHSDLEAGISADGCWGSIESVNMKKDQAPLDSKIIDGCTHLISNNKTIKRVYLEN